MLPDRPLDRCRIRLGRAGSIAGHRRTQVVNKRWRDRHPWRCVSKPTSPGSVLRR